MRNLGLRAGAVPAVLPALGDPALLPVGVRRTRTARRSGTARGRSPLPGGPAGGGTRVVSR